MRSLFSKKFEIFLINLKKYIDLFKMLWYSIKAIWFRGVAQVVAHQTGGLGVASSSLVTPTINSSYLKGFELFLFIRKNGLNSAYSDFLRISKSLSRILKMHQNLHQNQKSCTKSTPKKTNKNKNKRLCVFTFKSKFHPVLFSRQGWFC